MLRAKIVLKNADEQEDLGEVTLPDRPKIGDTVGVNYQVIGISYPVPIGKNISVGEPEDGAVLYVKDCRN